MRVSRKAWLLGSATATALLLQACSALAPADEDGGGSASADGVATSQAKDGANAKDGFAPGDSLAFEWSANGFEQLPSQYQWTGSGRRDEGFEPNFSLSVPETDDVVWSSSCTADGKIASRILFAPPKSMKNNRVTFKFETDKSTRTLKYDAKYIPDGQFDGFEIVQSANDQMFAEMKQATWSYMQMGDGDDAVKLRISLANAGKALNTFLPACSRSGKRAATTASPVVSYACEGGRVAKATYLGNDTDTPVVRLEVDGEVLLLPQAVSGSGIRYESEGGDNSGKRLAWLSKGDQAFLVESDGADEKTLSCRET
jgi:membrane-bound inhibitor of C-type lysozyme